MLRPHHLLTAIVPFGLAVAVCYLFGYWSRFGINALEYVGIGDVFKLSVFPMLFIMATFLVGTLIGLWLAHVPTGWFEQVVHFVFKPHYRPWFGLMWLLLAIVAFLFLPESIRWALTAILMTIAVVSVRNAPLVEAIVGQGFLPFLVLYYGTFLLLIAVNVGRSNAHGAVRGRGANWVDTMRSSTKFVGNEKAPVVFLGTLGETRFFYETCTGRTVVLDADSTLVLQARQTQPMDEPYGFAANMHNSLEGLCNKKAVSPPKPSPSAKT